MARLMLIFSMQVNFDSFSVGETSLTKFRPRCMAKGNSARIERGMEAQGYEFERWINLA
jgi:hypothetical protein